MMGAINNVILFSADLEPLRGMDRYLDSLFDHVLSDGAGVGYIP